MTAAETFPARRSARRPPSSHAVVAGRRNPLRGQHGQATVEFVALLPLLLVAGLAGAAILAGHSAGEHAGQAAQAGAMAVLQGGDPRAAAREALPAGIRGRARITVDGRRVTVRVRPRAPLAALAGPLTAEATTDAGPRP